MAGHSKWKNIKHYKAATDAKRGVLFTKLIREIMMAAKLGGGDPTANARLRLAIDAGRSKSLPKDNIERAIKKGTGDLEGDAIQEVTYEGYGPGGVALIIDAMTDNPTRTVADVRHGARGVVRHGVDDQRHATRSIALVGRFLNVVPLELTGAVLDGALDVVPRQRLCPPRVDRQPQASVPRRIAPAELGGHRDFAYELREQDTTLGVRRRLVVLDVLPFTVASHGLDPFGLAMGFEASI